MSYLFGSLDCIVFTDIFNFISFYPGSQQTYLCFPGVPFQQGPYSPTIFKNVLCLVLQIFLYLAVFECNTTSDWLNHMFSQSEGVLHSNLQNLGKKKRQKNVLVNGW